MTQEHKVLARYKFSMMRLAWSEEDERVYKAGIRNLGNMLVFAAIMLALAYAGYAWVQRLERRASGSSPQTALAGARLEQAKTAFLDTMKKGMKEDEWAKMKKGLEGKMARRKQEARARNDRVLNTVKNVVYPLCGVALLLAVMGPLSCLWGKVAIRITPREEIEVFERGTFYPTRRAWPISDFQCLQVASAGISRGRPRNRTWAGWHWEVRLVGAGGCVVFVPEVEPQREFSRRIPARAMDFLAWLRWSTRLPVGEQST